MKKNMIIQNMFAVMMITGLSCKTTADMHDHAIENKKYRVYENNNYQIIDTSVFITYYRYMNSDKPKGAAFIKEGKYFFSQHAASPIQLLTSENLKNTFPENLPFHYALDAQFKSNQDLMAYDSYCGCYKLKYVYLQTVK